MKFKLGLIVAAVAVLGGCSSTKEYQYYAEAQRAKVQADAIVEAAKWNALAEVAKSGDVTAKVAVAMAVQASGNGNKAPAAGMAAPKSSSEIALQWTSLLLPNLVQFYSINRNSEVAMRQSDNATALGLAQSNNQAAVSMNTNAAFSNIAAAGLTTANTIAGAGLTTANTISTNGFTGLANVAGQGITGVGSVANNASNAMVGISEAHSNAVISLSNAMQNLQPNVTTTNNNSYFSCPTGQTLTNGACQ